MTIAVTGATGLLGNNLVRMLLERGGADVRALLRLTSSMRPLEGLTASVIRVDLARATEIEIVRAIDGVESIIHCSALVGIGREHPDLYQAANVTATAALARACRRIGIRLVHVSTVDTMRWGTTERPGSETEEPGPDLGVPYVITKRQAETVVLDEVRHGLDAVIVNPAYMIGPWDWKPSSGRMLLSAARAPLLLAPPGGNDFVDARDVAAGALAALERGRAGERYILGGHPLTYTAAFQLFSDVAGRKKRARTAPPWLVRTGGRAAGVLGALTGGEYDINPASTEISILPHHFSSAKAVAELGYTFGSVEQAAQDAWAWFTAHGYT